MLGKGVKLYVAVYWKDTEGERNKEKEQESATERDSGVLRPWPRKWWTRGREVSEKLTTTERDKMSEKERNQASQLQNKCELIRPQEAFI